MKFTKNGEDFIEIYKGLKIIIEHNLNIYHNVQDFDNPIYTICGLGRTYQGEIEDVRKFIDYMFKKYSDY